MNLDLRTSLATAADTRLAVHITSDALRHVRAGHPWIWDGSIVRTSGDANPGDLAVIFDDKRKFAGIGLWDPTSAISVRMLHHGSPTTIDDNFFADKVLSAFARRQSLHDDPTTTGYRLVHGENDQLPGLVADLYDTTVVIKLDTVAWVPHLAAVVEPLLELTEAERVVLRSSRQVQGLLPSVLRDEPVIVGSPPTHAVEFLEHDLLFEADVERGQKTGHFLDQRDNRQLLGSRCRDADVLDVFCNTGGFGVYAAAGGARSVHSIDISHYAIEATRRHMERNSSRAHFDTRHTTHVVDAFDAMGDLLDQHRRFDVVVVDPPSFAPNAASVAAARRAYRRLTSLATELVATGGTLFQASCSSRVGADEFFDLVTDEIDTSGHQAINTIRTGHAVDHPVGFEHGSYLKAIMTEIVPGR